MYFHSTHSSEFSKKYFQSFLVLILCLSFNYLKGQNITLNEKGLSINSMLINHETSENQILELLGKPSKKSNLANVIWTYKKLGIHFHFDPETSKFKQVTVSLVKEDFPFSPSKPFAGDFMIYNDRIENEGDCDLIRGNEEIIFETKDFCYDKNHDDIYISLQRNISWGSYSSVSIGIK